MPLVNVRINQAGNEVCTSSVDYFGLRAFHRRHISDGGDPVPLDRDPILSNRTGIHVHDSPVGDDGIGCLVTQGDIDE
jgi:hypothetical protein